MGIENREVLTAAPTFYRTYSRFVDGRRESWFDVCTRTLKGLVKLGKLTDSEAEKIDRLQRQSKAMSSGRWLWVGGTEWLEQPDNFLGAYNCSSTDIVDWNSFAIVMNLAMMGVGTGTKLTNECISQLPVIRNRLNVVTTGEIGSKSADSRREDSVIVYETFDKPLQRKIVVGDSRKGWIEAYRLLLEFSSCESSEADIYLSFDISNIRPSGEKLKGFGGTANPVCLPEMFGKLAEVLNGAIGRQLNSVECCLLIDIAAIVIVAGNIRRSAGIRQFDADDVIAAVAKDNLWIESADGSWGIDPKRDPLRMANHTRVFHKKPTKEECRAAVTKQYHSGEGVIMWAGEAVARASADLIPNDKVRRQFIEKHDKLGADVAMDYLNIINDYLIPADELEYRKGIFGINPCGEIGLRENVCNLSEIHLNIIDPLNITEQIEAFEAGGLITASLLHHKFTEPRYQRGRELDPIVGVSFTGLFDFFVNLFGVDWLKWWEAGRPDDFDSSPQGWVKIRESAKNLNINELVNELINIEDVGCSEGKIYCLIEAAYLNLWRETVEKTVKEYCDRHGLKCPNRATTVQPSGTKALLTGASPGWHPPKAQRYIRRITFRKNDPVALACLDYGYSIIPSQSDKDENGNLLNDPFDPRCTEWLVEMPIEVPWASLPGADEIDISQFNALAQMDFYMVVQQNYARHNTSATIELRENEIESLADRIYQAIQNDEGYISAALLARFDDHQTFPRLPFEPISQELYDELLKDVHSRRKGNDFGVLLAKHDLGEKSVELGPSGCDSGKCMFPLAK
jgi:ribonucleotide reductase, class II